MQVQTNKTVMRGRGRPASFDRKTVLKQAMLVFWRFGYGGTSITDLTDAMGISAQSLYSAFGSKSELYHEVLDFYQDVYCTQMLQPLKDEPDIRLAIKKVLMTAAHIYCDKSHPAGCLIATANLGCAAEICDEVKYVASLRANTKAKIKKRIEYSINKRQWLTKIDAATLALFVVVVMEGMSVQAQDGCNEKELIAAINVAMGALLQKS